MVIGKVIAFDINDFFVMGQFWVPFMWVEGSLAYASCPGRANFSYISFQNFRNQKLARPEGSTLFR